MSGYQLIETSNALDKAASEWKKSREIAIDLECENNLHHYGTRISIIQVSTSHKNWVVDCLSVKNMAPMKQMLENPQITKIFHDVSFDFRVLQEELNCFPKKVFDTCVAAQFLGIKQVGLGSLIESNFGAKKQSKFQTADWLKRPLSRPMLSYAVKDTIYLIRLKEILENALRSKGRLGWVQEEFKYLETRNYRQDKPSFTDVKGAGKLNERQLSVLKTLFDEREKLAESLDKPVYYIISNKLLIELAEKSPRSAGMWARLKGVHPAIKKSAKKLNSLTHEARNNPIRKENGRKRPKRLTKAQERRFDELDSIRRKIAGRLEIEGFLILDREEMIGLATGGSIQDIKKWQQKLLLSENY